MEEGAAKKLIDFTCKGFALETASESPAPGGGSVSAYIGALGAALGTMVANLSSHKPGWDDKWNYFGQLAEQGQSIMNELLFLVDEDTKSFNAIMDAFGLPKSNDIEKAARAEAIQKATLYATEIPLRTMKVAYSGFDLVEKMAAEGNPNSVSDAGVGALCLRSAIHGAYLNVKINASGLKDAETVARLNAEADAIIANTDRREKEIIAIVNKVIAG